MQSKRLEISKDSKKALSELLSDVANTANDNKKDGLKDFAREHYYIEGQCSKDFGQKAEEKKANASRALESYAGDDNTLFTKLQQSGGQLLMIPLATMLRNILPREIDPEHVQMTTTDTDFRAHYVTDQEGQKKLEIYIALKSITIITKDGDHKIVLVNDRGKLVESEEDNPSSTITLAELRSTFQLSTDRKNNTIHFDINQLTIGLNHPDIVFDTRVSEQMREMTGGKLKPVEEGVVSYKTKTSAAQIVPKLLTALTGIMLLGSGIGALAIIGVAIANRGFQPAFNKASNWFQQKLFSTLPAAREFSKTVRLNMPKSYTEESHAAKELNMLTETTIKEPKAQKKIDGSIAKIRERLKNTQPKKKESICSENEQSTENKENKALSEKASNSETNKQAELVDEKGELKKEKEKKEEEKKEKIQSSSTIKHNKS